MVKVTTYIITSIADLPIGLDAMLVIMPVSIFKTDVILYIMNRVTTFCNRLEIVTITKCCSASL